MAYPLIPSIQGLLLTAFAGADLNAEVDLAVCASTSRAAVPRRGRRWLGALAKMLEVAPTNFSDKDWQTAASDEAIERIIVEGGFAVGKSAAMKPLPQLAEDDRIRNGLVALVSLRPHRRMRPSTLRLRISSAFPPWF